MEKQIFPELENVDYIERYYGIRQFLKNINHPLWKFSYTWGTTEKNLEKTFGAPFPIKPMVHYIKEFPFAVSIHGEIICMKNPNTCPSIAIYGFKGVGKTILGHVLIEGFYWFFNYAAFIANDYQIETIPWASPCKSNDFLRKIKIFGKEPAPLPLFLVIPNSERDFGLEKLRTPKIKIVLPLDYLTENIEKFTELEGTEKYFKNMNFVGCNTEEEFKKRVEEEFERLEVPKKARGSMIPKINTIMHLFFKDKMISPEKNVVERLKMDNDGTFDFPIIQLLKTNVIPSLITTAIEPKWWFHNYIEFIISSIIQRKQDDREFKKRKLVIFVDELNKIIEGKNKEKINETMRITAAQGRIINIALIYAAQNPLGIDTKIKSNCKYMFCFGMASNKEINELKKDYNLGEKGNKIRELKTFEFIGKSKDEPFVLYDPINNERTETDFVHGFVIPPISHHQAPASSKHEWSRTDEKITTNYAKKVILDSGIILRNPKYKERGGIIGACDIKNYLPNFPTFKIKRAKIIEGIDYRRAFFNLRLDESSDNVFVDYDFVKKRDMLVYLRNNKYYLLKNKEATEEDIPVIGELPKDVFGIQYNHFMQRYRLITLSKKSDQKWYPKKSSLGWEKADD